MDNFSQSGTFDVLKEPRGFVRVLQLLFAIFAFATTSAYTGHINIEAQCGNDTKLINITVAYPFALSSGPKCKPVCLPVDPLYGNFSSGAQFFVFVGVITFLYCIGVLILYTVFIGWYESNVRFRKADFGLSSFLALLWFIASVSWASGVDLLKRYTDSAVIQNEICGDSKCTVDSLHAYAGLNISLIFGFSNVALWAASLWFLWKETPWFRGESDPMQDAVLPPADGGSL